MEILRLGIVADDLSGACECAGQVRALGGSAVVLPTLNTPLPASQADAWVINTDSRHCQPDEAAKRVRLALQVLEQVRATWWYKKTDSTLRGPIAAELAAFAHPDQPLLYAPAYPGARRLVEQGILRIDGVPVSQTDFARDPQAPVSSSQIIDLFHNSELQPQLRSRDQLSQPLVLGPGLWICDGIDDHDVQAAAHTCALTQARWAGPAALLGHLFRRVPLSAQRSACAGTKYDSRLTAGAHWQPTPPYFATSRTPGTTRRLPHPAQHRTTLQ